MELRKRYVDGNKLKATTDAKIWKYEVKYLQNDLSTSQEKLAAFVKNLDKI